MRTDRITHMVVIVQTKGSCNWCFTNNQPVDFKLHTSYSHSDYSAEPKAVQYSADPRSCNFNLTSTGTTHKVITMYSADPRFVQYSANPRVKQF